MLHIGLSDLRVASDTPSVNYPRTLSAFFPSSFFFLRSPVREDVKLLCESERGVVLSSVFRSTEEGAAEVYTVYLKLIF